MSRRALWGCTLVIAGAMGACVQAAPHPGDDGTGGAPAGSGGHASGMGGATGIGGAPAGMGGATGLGGQTAAGVGGRTGVGGTTGVGGAPAGQGGFIGVGLPPLVPEFTDDFEDGNLMAPPVKWLSTTHDAADVSAWGITTDGTRVVNQTMPADETEMVSGDYRWKDASMEAKVKLLTPANRAGVCVRWQSVREKYCAYLEQLEDNAGVINWAMELRMRSDKGSASSLPKIKGKDLATPIAVSLTGFNTVKLEVHGGTYTASLNGTMVFTFTDTANLVQTGGVAMSTNDGGEAEFDDAHAVPFN